MVEPDAPTKRRTLHALAEERPVTCFVGLAIGLSWLVWVPTFAAGSEASWPMFLGAFGPAGAAAILVRLRGGTVSGWLRTILRFRLPTRWYVAALALPLIDPLVQTWLAWQAQVPLSVAGFAERIPLWLGSFLVVLVIGGGQEELGWRGWLLPALQQRTDPLRASLVIGVIHATWHLPLFAFGAATYGDTVFALYLPFVVAGAVVFTWLSNSGRSSLVLAVLFHAQLNVASALVPVADLNEYEAALADGAPSVTTVQAAVTIAWTLTALVLVWRDRSLGLQAAIRPMPSSTRGAHQ